MLLKKLEEMAARYEEVNLMVQDADLIKDQKRYKEVMREHSHLTSVMEAYKEYKEVLQGIEDAKVIITEEEDHDMKEMAREELKELEEKQPVLEEKIKFLLIPPDPLEEKNIIVEIRAGTGGDESSLFAADLFRMYTRYAEKQGWRVSIIDSSPTELGGFKEISFSVDGAGAFSRLKYERGTHRVQRVPETESGGRIHTSTASVAVMPEAEEVDVVIDEKDIRIDVMRASGNGGQCVNTTDSAVRLTHFPSGIVVYSQTEKSQLQNRDKAFALLRAKLYDLEQQKAHDAEAAARRSQIGTGDRSEKIRTYNFPQSRVTDHRIGLTLYKLDKVLNGDLQELLDGLTAADQAAKLAKQEEL